MTFEIAYVIAIFAAALALFAWDRLPVDVVGVMVVVLLVLPGSLGIAEVLGAADALAGFGNETVIVLISLFVLTAGVVKTGVVERIGLRLAGLGGQNPRRTTAFLLITVTTVSAFFANTVTTAAFLPIVIGMSRRAGIPLSKILMPLAFASILSSPVTLISSSTNLLVSGLMPRWGLEPIGFFEMAKAGLPITVLGMVYLIVLAPRLLPDHSSDTMTDRYGLRRYLTEALVAPGSKMVGKTLGETGLGSTLQLNVVSILRGEARIVPLADVRLEEGDVLIVEGSAEDVLLLKDAQGLDIRPDRELSDPDLQSGGFRLVEAAIMPRSDLAGQTLRESHLRDRSSLTVLAIHAPGGRDFVGKIARRILREGDILLLQGRESDLAHLETLGLMPLDDVSAHHPRTHKGRWAAAIFVAAVALGAAKILPLAIAFLIGALALVLTRCLTSEEAYESVDWRMMVLIGSMIAFGSAMEKTGAARWVSGLIVEHAAALGPTALLAGFFLLTVLLTQPMSNQAAALVVLPVAIEVARGFSYSPRTFVMTVAFAASCSFLTPLEPSCLLVYGPGRYRFFDFTRVGGILTLIVFIFAILLIPIFWPLTAGR
ncbi:MAG TPA: SLC13 family permease [Thermoanaerobaculia bacterium]